MKTEHRYLWRVTDRGKRRITITYLTEEQVMRDHPEGQPERLPETLKVVEVPVTADEILAHFARTPNQYGPGGR